MARNDYKLFIEFSSSQIRGCVVDLQNRNQPKLRIYHVPVSGMKFGAVADFEAVFEGFLKLIDLIENDGFLKVDRCTLVVSGNATFSRPADCKLFLNGLTASQEHAKKLREDSYSGISTDREELVELVEQEWRIDDKAFDSFPFGKTGNTLGLSSYCYMIDKSTLKQYIDICNQAGLTVLDMCSGQVGLKRLISRLSPHYSNMLLLDIGFTSTSGLLCVGQKENSTFVVRAGSLHITRDIAAALHCDMNLAESLKLSQGLQVSNPNTRLLGEACQTTQTQSFSEKTTTFAHTDHRIYPWAAPRVSEIFTLCLKHFAIYAKALDGGVMLVGGGSQLLDICGFLSSKFSGIKITRFKPNRESLEVALGLPIEVAGNVSLSGFEGLLEQSWSYSQKATQSSGAFGFSTPKMLRPLLTWFIDLSK